MKALMTFNKQINANIVVTKISNQKSEKVRILGDKGSVYIDGRTVTLLDNNEHIIKSYTYSSKDDEMDQQLDFFIRNYSNKKFTNIKDNLLLSDQALNMRIIDAIYKSDEEEKVINFNKEVSYE